jgi:hypothetical protein
MKMNTVSCIPTRLKYLVGLVEARSCNCLANRRYEPSTFMCDFGFSMFNLGQYLMSKEENKRSTRWETDI